MDASIQARIEAGEPPEEAERTAVRALGDSLRVVRRIAEDLVPRRPSESLLFLSLIGAFAAYLGIFWRQAHPWSTGCLIAIIVCLALAVRMSWNGRGVRWRCLLAILPVVWIGLAVALATQGITLPSWDQPVPRPTQKFIASREGFLQGAREQLRLSELSHERYRSTGNLTIPNGYNFEKHEMRYRRAKDLAFAATFWRIYERSLPATRSDLDRETRKTTELAAATDAPFWPEIPYQLLPAATIGYPIPLILVGLHLLVVFARWFLMEVDRSVRALRRRLTSRGGTPAR